MPPTKEIAVAKFSAWKPVANPRAVLVLCPGQNDSSLETITSQDWQQFAKSENLALVGMQLVSKDEDLLGRRGYFAAGRESGKLLEEALAKMGLQGLPLLLYGFSGGAHFSATFASFAPERVAGFCAYSFGWWEAPNEKLRSPALIVCGQADGARYASTFSYFQNGRKGGRPWLWLSLEGQDHSPSPALDEFVRSYFSALLKYDQQEPITVDNLTSKPVKGRQWNDVESSVLPSAALLPAWQALHHP